jgi:serine/threonine-protein kinase
LANHRAHSSPEVDLPKRIGRYAAFHQIGAGGMARVYLGSHRGPRGSELAVIKQLRPDITEDDQVLNMFLDEARIAMRLDHPNVVRTREVIAESPDYCLVMEFLDGQSLLQVLKRVGWKGVPRDAHIWILTQVLAGLEFAHDLKDAKGRPHGIVHRDVSPSNVLVCYTGEVKLLDFGIAKASGALAATHQGVVKGKVGYAAPEQCLGKAADPRSDLYSVGVMLWEAVAGRRRSSGETQLSILQGRIQDSEPPLEKVCPDAHPALVRIARRALARAPEMRYATAREFRNALEQYLAAQARKVGASEVAALMRKHFEQDRAELQKIIFMYGALGSQSGTQPAVGSGQSGTVARVQMPVREALPTVPAFPAVDMPPVDLLRPNDEDTSPIPVDDALLKASRRGDSLRPPSFAPPASSAVFVPRAPSVPVDINPFAPPKRGRTWLWFVSGMLVTAAAAGIFVTRTKPKAERVTAPTATTLATPVAATTPAPSSPPASAPASQQIKLRILVSPEDARVRLDGRLLKGNPYVAEVERDGLEHELTVSADKHREETHTLRFDEDIDLELSLESSRGARRARIVRGGRVPVALPPPAEPAAAAPAPVSRPTPQKIEPGMDLEARPSSRGKNKIDEKDPYAK